MAPYSFRRRRFRPYRSFRRSRRSLVRIRRYRPRVGTNRFLRYQRKVAKPEIKFATNGTASATVGAEQVSTPIPVSTQSMAGGAGEGLRVGNEIKTRKILFNLTMSADDDSTIETNRVDGIVRVVLWSPRRIYDESADYMSDIDMSDWQIHLDWNSVQVHRDIFVRLGYAGHVFTAGTENFLMINQYPSKVTKRFVLNWPRTVRFGPSSDNFDADKDVLFMTIINPNTWAVGYDWDSKLTYIDP